MRTAHMAIGLAAVVGVVPASFAQDSQVPNHGKSAGTGIEAGQRQAHQRFGGNTGVSVAVPVGRVSVSAELLDGEPTYVRRTTVGQGITIVEVSTAPFMPGPPGVDKPTVTPAAQPASW